MNNSDKGKESRYKWIQTVAVFLILFYCLQALFSWLVNSSLREKAEGFGQFFFILSIAILFYLLACWSTGMPIDLGAFFGFD